jgi:hypothetical protein
VIGFFQNRGLDKKTAVEAALQLTKDYREVQAKLVIPADRVLRLPADAADEAGWKAVYQKLGVPPDPSGYDFSTVKRADGSDIDAGLATFMRETAAQLNIPKDAATQIAQRLIKREEDGKAAAAVAGGTALALAKQELATSWGANGEANRFAANRTAGMLGFDQAFIDALPADKYVGFMQQMLDVSARTGEAPLLGNQGGGSGARPVLTREGAMARLSELGGDKAWYARFSDPRDPGHKAAVDEWNHLNSMLVSAAR